MNFKNRVHALPEANVAAGGLRSVKLGMFLPREILASLYNFSNGELFFAHLCGTRNASCQFQVAMFLKPYLLAAPETGSLRPMRNIGPKNKTSD